MESQYDPSVQLSLWSQVLEVSEGAPVLRTHLTRSESGVYECVATNSAGENRTQLTLVVEGQQTNAE